VSEVPESASGKSEMVSSKPLLDLSGLEPLIAADKLNAIADKFAALRAELDNERAAMRNVQECAESYRRERDEWKEIADRASVATSAWIGKHERLRAALDEARHVMRWEMGYQDGDRNIDNADKVCAKIDSLIGVADETKREKKDG